MKVFVLTHSPSPYQVELFNKIASDGMVELRVAYLYGRDLTRRWNSTALCHEAMVLDEEAKTLSATTSHAQKADLLVFNYYNNSRAAQLIHKLLGGKQPWCFWGERLGFRKPEWAGWVMRRLKLSWLRNSRSPIWGIGRFAVEGYRKEFGLQRVYCNMPYFSNLDRFRNVKAPERGSREIVFLFSGSLIYRKGVDLLARAFVRLAREMFNVRLMLMGDGELRETLAKTLQPVRDRVEFLGFKDWPELPSCYAAADVLCAPSRYDGWGLVVPEGLAAGLPVIGTNQTGAAIEFIKASHNGWLITAGDEDALFGALREAALLPSAKLTRLSGFARESVAEHSLRHGAERFIRASHEAYENWRALN